MANGRFDLNRTLGSSYAYAYCKWSSTATIETNESILRTQVYVGKTAQSTEATRCTMNTYVSVSNSVEGSQKVEPSGIQQVNPNTEILVFDKTFKVPHNDDGTRSVTISVSIGNNNVFHANASADITLDTIKRATELPGFATLTVENQTVFTLSPYINNAKHSIKFVFGNTQMDALLHGTTRWLSANLTLGTTETLLMGNTLSVTLPPEIYDTFDGASGYANMVLYTYSGATKIDSKSKWIKILPGLNCTPVITARVRDTNEKTIALTGGADNIVANASVVEIVPTIQVSDVDDKNARVVSKSVDNEVFTEDIKIIPNPKKKDFLISVTNNRGLTGNYTASASGRFIPYVDLTFNVDDISRTEPTSAEVTINYSGKFFSGEFTDNLGDEGIFNNLTILWYYRVKDSDSDFLLGGELIPDIDSDNNTYSGYVVLGDTFNYKNNYEFEFRFSDKLNTYVKDKVYLPKGQPILWWNEHSVSVLGDLYVGDKILASVDPETGESSIFEVYPVGSIYMNVNPTNPGELFGGVWEQLPDRFLLGASDTHIGGEEGGSIYHQHEYGLQYGGYYSAISIEGNDNCGLLDYDADNNITPSGGGSDVGNATLYINGSTTESQKGYSMRQYRMTANTSANGSFPPYVAVYMWERVS